MKILLSGYHNPHFVNSTVYRERAIEYLGHTLISFDDRRFLIPGRIREAVSWLQDWDLKRINGDLLSLVRTAKPDLCIINGGQRILPETVSAVKNTGTVIVLWTTDVPVDFDNILSAAPFYDHLFCGGSEALDIFERRGFHHISWLPFGCDPHFHRQIELSKRDQALYRRDLVFVGSYYPNRADVLEGAADLDIGVWGPYWRRLPPQSRLRGKAVDVKMNYAQWVKIYNASKMAVAIHYNDGRTPCHQASPKVFEAMACGCLVLTDRQKDVMRLFADKEHVVFFDGPDDLAQKARFYAANDQERRRIAEAGRQEVITRHRYQDRIQEILNVLGKA